MSEEERRTVVWTTFILLMASLLRLGWEARPVPPILPPDSLSTELIEATRQEVAAAERMRTPLGPGERVDPNRDAEEELARLPGVGPALALRIVESRTSEGPYRTPADLLRVAGIGPATLDRIEPLVDLTDPPTTGPGPSAGGTVAVTPRPGSGPTSVDLNAAGAAELQNLPGIGPALADRILAHRAREGQFSSVEDLLEVSGIGPATLDRLREQVRVGY